MANKKQSTAELIGISHFSRNGLMTKRYGEVVYFIVQPTNISVLSETSIAIKINHLMQLLSEQPDIEIICSDARENFEYNKLSLARKAEKEENLKVQLLLRRDMKFLDDRIIETYLQGGQGNLSGAIVKELSADFPSLKEQKTIGDFFRQLDNLITLHQRERILHEIQNN